jgi:hypothetical protein
MALTTSLASMVLGDRSNAKQMVFGIPAGPSGEDPGILCLESVNSDASTYSKVYLWADSAGVLRYDSSIPSDEDSDGTIIAGTAASTAARNLSNLLTTSINTDLLPGTTSTSALGSSSYYWLGTYTDVLYLYSDAYLTGASGKMTLTGDFVAGANGTGVDFTFYGDTSDVYMWWDRNANTNGALIFTGATASPSLQFTNTNVTYTAIMASDILTIDATDHSSAKITIGNDATTNGIDFTYFMHTTGSAITIDAGADTLRFDDMTLSIRTASTDTMDITSAANNVYFDAGTANDILNIGNTTAMDVLFHGNDAGRDARWDASADTLGLLDNAILGFGNTAAAPDISIKWDATDLLIDGAAADTVIKIGATNNQNVQIYAATATNYVLFDTDDTKSAATFAGISAIFNDATYLAFGTGASTNGDIKFTYTGGTNILGVTQVASGTGSMTYGADGKGIDQTWYVETASSYIKLDQANDRMLFYIAKLDIGNATVTYDFAMSTNSLVLSATDNAGSKLILGTTGTNGLDVTFQSATAGDLISFDAGAKTMTFTDVTGVFVKNSADFNGLVIPSGATASPSGAATAGSVYYEVDAHRLWVCEGGTTWVYFQNAG